MNKNGVVGKSGGSDNSYDWRSALFPCTSTDTSHSSAVESLILNPISNVLTISEGVFCSAGGAMRSAGETILHPTESMSPKLSATRSTAREKPGVIAEARGEKSSKHSSENLSPPSPAVAIRSVTDGAEVELLPKDCDPISDSERPSFLTMASSDKTWSMDLKVLRGQDLPFGRCNLRITVIDPEGPSIGQLLGSTPTSAAGHSPIWGGPSCSWPMVGSEATLLLFTVTNNDSEVSSHESTEDPVKGAEGQNEAATGKPIVCAKVFAADLIDRGMGRNPNCWIGLKDYGTTGIESCGRIEVRLTQSAKAILHKQENCPLISPGPAFPFMQSYALRKMALYSCNPVILNVYDVSNNPRIAGINNTTKTIGFGGIFHAAIEINGREYSFGGTMNRKSKVTGVFSSSPKQCPMHHYRESVYLGDCELSAFQINGVLDDLRPRWRANSYNLFRKNCAFFSRELAIELGVGDIPRWVYSLASTAEFIEPYAVKLNTYLNTRTANKASPSSNSDNGNKSSTVSTNSTHSSEEGIKLPSIPSSPGNQSSSEEVASTNDALPHSDPNIEARKVATTTQEWLLDHAMAARIQRSFRATSARDLSNFRSSTVRRQ